MGEAFHLRECRQIVGEAFLGDAVFVGEASRLKKAVFVGETFKADASV